MVHSEDSLIQDIAMMKYCRLTKDSIQMVKNMVRGDSSSLQLNTQQCWFLAWKLAGISGLLQSLADRQGSADCPPQAAAAQTALVHLFSTIKKAELLVEKCCCKSSSWIVSAMTLVEIEEEFAALVLDLHERSIILELAVDAASGLEPHEKIWTQLQRLNNAIDYRNLEERQELHQEALKDKRFILSKLAQVQEPQYCQRDCLTASYLQSWLNHTGGDQTQDAGQTVFNLNEGEQEKLGEGSFCTVWKVTWLGLHCALKKFKGALLVNKEAQAMRDLHHPNIVRLYSYWNISSPCLLMELMPQNLYTYMHPNSTEVDNPSSHSSGDGESSSSQKKPSAKLFSLPVAIDIMLQIAQAMLYLHERNLTHRDLKPQNVLVSPVSERLTDYHVQGYLDIKLVDFGSAKEFDSASTAKRHTMNTGTTMYGAPEIFNKEWVEGEHFMKFGADVWSFGIMCAEILSGEAPYGDEPRKTLPKSIQEGLRPALKHCPEYLAFCIRGCWEYQPRLRPDFASICKLLRHAKWLSLGLTSLNDTRSFLKYTTQAGFVKVYDHEGTHWYDPLLPSGTKYLNHSSSKRHRVC